MSHWTNFCVKYIYTTDVPKLQLFEADMQSICNVPLVCFSVKDVACETSAVADMSKSHAQTRENSV